MRKAEHAQVKPGNIQNGELQRFHKQLASKGVTSPLIKEFRRIIYDNYQSAGRPFPWRETEDPYAILVSEIMLQQTQTDRVVPKYLAFLEMFPDFPALANAPLNDVLMMWQGLGYNRRGKALRDIAQMVVERFGGVLPDKYDDLLGLPGIGPYTAGAVCAFAFNQPVVFMDTNIRRVFIHFFFPDQEKVKDKEIELIVEQTLDRKQPREWYSALMDYGALFKKKGSRQKRGGGEGEVNPNRRSAHYTRQSKFEGSDRQIRGAILRELLKASGEKEGGESIAESELAMRIGNEIGEGKVVGNAVGVVVEEVPPSEENEECVKDSEHTERVRYILDQMEREGLVMEEKGKYSIPK